MKIGRTNAITISGGGTTKTPYDEWQEGFGVNWDSVVANAPMTNTQRILHIYTKVEFLKMRSEFPTIAEIYTYNGSVYRQITMDTNKRLAFVAADYITNTSDNLQYVCVVYGNVSWGNYYFNTYLPVVYSNSKACNDNYNNLTNIGGGLTFALYPYLRGIDCKLLGSTQIGNSLEHLTIQSYNQTIQLIRIAGSDTQVRLLKDFVENAPVGTTFTLFAATTIQYCALSISDEKLADWVYNDFFYNRNPKTSYSSGFPVSNVVKKFNINPNMIFKGNDYLAYIPNMVYIEGYIEEDTTQTDANAGMCNFRNSGLKMLQNFPMWKVKEDATTGCLLPMKTQANVAAYLNGSFRFYSTNLEPNLFCEFDENGIIEDPTKYFICNLPIETISHANIQVKFEDLTFKNQFTAEEQTAIQGYLNAKNWNLLW